VEGAAKDDAQLKKRMRTKGKAAMEDFKQAKKKGSSKKIKDRQKAANAIPMHFK
jgi:hypothetical protein